MSEAKPVLSEAVSVEIVKVLKLVVSACSRDRHGYGCGDETHQHSVQCMQARKALRLIETGEPEIPFVNLKINFVYARWIKGEVKFPVHQRILDQLPPVNSDLCAFVKEVENVIQKSSSGYDCRITHLEVTPEKITLSGQGFIVYYEIFKNLR